MARERTLVIRSPLLFGGISQQAAHIRNPDQVEDAENAVFSVVDGMSKRAGSQHVTTVGNLTGGGNYRLHAITRDQSERYLVIYGEGDLRPFDLSGNEIPITVSTDGQSYLDEDSPSADELRLSTVRDFTFIVNTNVNLAAATSDDYDVEDTHTDYDILISKQPTNDTFHRTESDTANQPAGYWQYTPGSGRFAEWTSTDLTHAAGWDDVDEAWDNAAVNPGGIKVELQRFDTGAVTGASWDVSELQLTKTGAFADYDFRSGEQINVTGGTGVTSGWYTISQKVDDDTLELASSIAGSDQTDVTFDGIGTTHDMQWNFEDDPPTDMEDLGQRLQQALRDAGAEHALIYWTELSPTTGSLTIVSPYRGNGTEIVGLSTPDDSDLVDFSGKAPFDHSSGTSTAGSGTPITDTLDPLERWTRVAAPNQVEAGFDATTMPVQMRRIIAPVYESTIEADSPFAYWRLGESSGTTATNEMGSADGTYTNSPTLGVTGALTSDTDTAVTFASASSQYVVADTLDDFGSSISSSGGSIELWFKTTDTDSESLCGNGTSQNNTLRVEKFSGSADLRFTLTGASGTAINAFIGDGNDALGIADGNWHHLVITFDPDAATAVFYLDNTTPSITYATQTSDTVSDFTQDFHIAATYNGGATNFADASIDEVALYVGQLTAKQVDEHYQRGTNNITFDVDLVDWKDRFTGQQNSNPVPSLIEDQRQLADISFHRNRLVLAGDTNLVFSQAGDFFNFFIGDADNIVDSDPIDIALSSDEVTLVDFVVPFRQSMIVFTKAGRQFELNAPEALTPDTAAITPSTSYKSLSVRPQPLGSFVYFASETDNNGRVLEYFFDDTRVTNRAADVTKHVPDLLPADIRTIQPSTNNEMAAVIGEDDATVYVYTFYFPGSEKEQSAWTKFVFDSSYRIADVAIIRNTMFMLVESASQFFIEKINIAPEIVDPNAWYSDPRIDRRVNLTGVYSAGNDETTWTLPFTDSTIDKVVLDGDWGSSAGTVLDVKSNDGTSVVVDGDYSANDATLGREYTMSVELTRPYARNRQGFADVDAHITVRKLAAHYRNTGDLTLKSVMRARVNRTKSLSVTGVDSDGVLIGRLNGNAEDNRLFVEATGARPCTVTAVEHTVDYVPRDE